MSARFVGLAIIAATVVLAIWDGGWAIVASALFALLMVYVVFLVVTGSWTPWRGFH